MVDISRKKYEKNCVETLVDNDGTWWLNEKEIEEGLDHKNLRNITANHSDHRKRRHDLDNK